MENIIQKVTDLLSGLDFIPTTGLKLAFVGVVLIVLFFAIALILAIFSNIKGLSKKLLSAVGSLSGVERVDEQNVENLNSELKKLPEAVSDGWSRFMEQRLGYPSDYMKEKSVLDENTYTTKNTLGKIFFRVFGFLVFALVAVLATLVLADDAANLGLKDFFDNFKVVGGIVASVVLPIFFFIVFDIILNVVYRKQRKRLQLVYKSFLDSLDAKVVIYAAPEEPFISDNLEQITKDIDEIIAQRAEGEPVEVVTAPEIEELEKLSELEAIEETEEDSEEEEEAEEEETQEAEEETVAAAPAPMPEEEQKSYLAVLITIVENAINDPEVKTSELEEIAELIYGSLDVFDAKVDRDVLEECLRKLADVFYAKK